MEQRLANAFIMTVNEKKFIETALISELRVDGRRPFECRRLTIKFGREDGSSEVQLGQTRVMGFVTSQLVQPYRDRPNEGTLSIYTEFSPMADPSFEAGRPGESAIELGRIIDRGLRESRAVDTETLCVIAGKLVWSIRVDLHIVDNGGNLVDAANVAALASLSTFRRPECTVGGEDGQEVTIHPPEVREALPLIIHHLPVAVTFAFFGKENTVVIDPTHREEAVMGGRMTATLNAKGDICAIQKAGGGVLQSVIMQCLRIASVKAADITKKIKDAVESYNTERSLRKVKRHTISAAVNVNELVQKVGSDLLRHHVEKLTSQSEKASLSLSSDIEVETDSLELAQIKKRNVTAKSFIGGPSNWDPYSKGINVDDLKTSLLSRVALAPHKAVEESSGEVSIETEPNHQGEVMDETKLSQEYPNIGPTTLPIEAPKTGSISSGETTLKDAVKPKHRRKRKAFSARGTS